MTDKEIIIDGIDVGEWTLDEIEYHLYHKTKSKIIEAYSDIYKQLQRKEQECETKQKALEIQKGFLDDAAFQVKTLKVENEELKRQKDIIKGWSKYLGNWKDNLLKENNRYKQALETIDKYIKTTLNVPLERRFILNIINEVKDE